MLQKAPVLEPDSRLNALLIAGYGVDDQLAAVAEAFTLRAHAGCAGEFEMDDAPLARRHRIEAEFLAGLAHALRGDARRKFQFLEPRGAVVAAIEAHAVVQARVKPQPAVRQMLEREKKFRVAIEQQFLIRAPKRNHQRFALR